jgi:aminoglycoside 6'-N-acetyltransferase
MPPTDDLPFPLVAPTLRGVGTRRPSLHGLTDRPAQAALRAVRRPIGAHARRRRMLMHTEAVDLSFERLRSSDLSVLATWLARPHVQRWWREPSDLASVEENYGPLLDGSDPTEGFMVHLSGRPIGYVQRYLIDDDPEWREAMRSSMQEGGGIGIDYLIGEPDLVGRGIGRDMISRFVAECFGRYPAENRIVVGLQQDNVASWKALEASGFRRVWAGDLESSDPSDQGPSFIYLVDRGTP